MMSIQSFGSLERLQQWYADHCDDDWEHTYQIKIETLDNPGWVLRIDLGDTDLHNLEVERVIDERSETDWVQYEVKERQFIACGGIFNLEEMIGLFFELYRSLPNRE